MQLPPELWRIFNKGHDGPWVLFRNGTCVRLPSSSADPAEDAKAFLRQEGPVHVGTPSGDFDVLEIPVENAGWLVTFHHSAFATYVGPDVLDPDADYDEQSVQMAVGLWGRKQRERDAEELDVVHVEQARD